MRKIFTLLAITFLTIFQGYTQTNVNYERDTRWFIGLNAGGTWTTQTEVPYVLRGGYGLTFGKSFGMEPDKMFSWDIRARFLHAQVKGQATDKYELNSASTIDLTQYGSSAIQTYQDLLGYFFPNYKTDLLRGSIELVLNTNRLRQRTGWNLSVFGGIGITGYHTTADILNDDFLLGSTYDFNQVGGSSVSNLLDFQDGNYETDLVGSIGDYNVDWMPSFGFGISKQIHPAVAIGLEHKMTWTRTNLFDGMPNNFDGIPSDINDKYHYTALTIKFHLFRGKTHITEEPSEEDFDTYDEPDVVDPVSQKKPIVDIYDPNSSPYTTTSNSFNLKANVHYVDGKSNISFKQDGNINTNFTYNSTTDKFESNVVLHPGQNLFEITGVNDAGSDYESVIIIYEKEEDPKNPPIVTITNPPYTPHTTTSDVFGLVSTVLNVDRKSQIRVYLNGVNLNSFSYGLDSKLLNASLKLIEGTNTIKVTATNEVGSDSKTVQIIYEKPEKLQPPIVDFVNPGVNPFYTTNSTIDIRATALNVSSKSKLTIKVNGSLVGSFTFNPATKEIYFHTNLILGANNVEITGVNLAGSDYASTTIIYSRPETPKPPIVTFIDPEINPITVYSSMYNVKAKVQYVNAKSNITLKINGVVSGSFTYSTSSNLMNFTTSLVEGSNVIEIKGVNAQGMDIESTTIIHKRTIPEAPPIVNITYPAADNVIFGSPNVNLAATILNVASASDITVVVNGVPTGSYTYNAYTKVLNLPLILNEGSNTIKITGTNMAGSDSKTRFIIYKKPANPAPPTVEFINPSTSPYLADVGSFTVTANTTNIDSKGQISFKQNGVLISSDTYSFVGGHQIVYNATLIVGSNIFEVSAENEDGTASDLTVINYVLDEDPCVIPTVGYISPVPYSTVDNPAITIDAQINNYSVGTTVEIKLNGVSKGYMTYNAGTSIASKGITLLEGSNAITVKVTNACGTNQATFTLVYIAADAPCYLPSLTASGSTSITTQEAYVSLTLSSANISNVTEISVLLNGSAIPFTFDAGTGGLVIGTINLNLGSNSVIVSATTGCGSALLVYTIIREECKLPVISGISPANGTTVEETSVVFNAKISHVDADEITFLLNGVSQAFSFNSLTKVLSQALTLEVGSNTIEIRASNPCGDQSKIIKITREIPCSSILTSLLSPASNSVNVTEESYDITMHTSGLTGVEQIKATLNGVSVSPTFDPVSGNIQLSGLSLQDGVNTVIINMKNDCSESIVTYTINYKGCEPPVIILNGISLGIMVTESIFNLGAIVTNISGADDIVLKVNGVSIDFDFNSLTNLLTANFSLNEGSNSIQVIASGCESATKTATIVYEKPCDVISHTLLSPLSNTVTSAESIFSISLRIAGIESADQVGVKLNGTSIPFSFNAESNIITITGMELIDGSNSVVIRMANDCSSDLVKYTINYDGCVEPVINFGVMPSSVSEAEFSFEANVLNIAGAGSVQLTLNGAPATIVYNSLTGSLDAELTFVEGENTIRIVANGCERVEKTVTIDYSIPCEKITYSLGHPSILSTSSADATYNINLVVSNAGPGGVFVTQGGSPISHTYIDDILSINGIVLTDGLNTIVVNLANDCSSEKLTYIIGHDGCTAPEINLSANVLTSATSNYNFVGTVSGLESADQLIIKLNGAVKPFMFNVVSGGFMSSLTLVEGSNLIEVTANGCEKVSKSIRVNYTVPCAPVTYSLVSPGVLVSTMDVETMEVRLNTSNVDPETVSATINGESISATISGGIINVVDIPMSEGSNSISVNFGNECSDETVVYTVEHEHCETPSIIINGLTDGMILTEGELFFFANIYEVDDAGEIMLKFNGVSVPFDFNPETHLLQTPLTLREGANEIEIIVNGCERVTGGVDVIYDAPCVVPTYTRVTPTEPSVTVVGDVYTISVAVSHVTEGQISVKINGGFVDFTYSGGTVIVVVPYISVPTNVVEILLTNDCGSAAVDYTVTYLVEEEDCAPTVSATFTENKKAVTASSNKPLVNVILNLDDGSTQLIEDVAGMSGTFSAIDDKAGKCIVGVWIRSGCNLSAAGEPFGDYIASPEWDGTCASRAPCNPITYSLVTPSRVSITSKVSPYTIVLTTANVKSVSNILALVNGVTKNVSFASNRITLSGINLVKGVNTVQFVLTNECSTETITYTITYSPAPKEIGRSDKGFKNDLDNKDDGNYGGDVRVQAAPIIAPISPATTKSIVKSQTVSLKANIKNVSSKSNITLIVNGVKFSNFVYNSQTEEMSALIRLKSGLNSIMIIAKNGSKTELTYYITYQEPVQQKIEQNKPENDNKLSVSAAPILKRIAPSSITANTSSKIYRLKVKATNVTSKAGITLILNGKNIPNFTFSSSSQIISAVLLLREGANTVRILAKNGDKQASLNYTITYKKPAPNLGVDKSKGDSGSIGSSQVAKKPVIKKVSPTSTTATVKNKTFVLKANIANLSSKSDITFTVNGVKSTAFTFNPKTGDFVATLTLKSGTNSIKITAKNGNLTATATYSIKYEVQNAIKSNRGESGGFKQNKDQK